MTNNQGEMVIDLLQRILIELQKQNALRVYPPVTYHPGVVCVICGGSHNGLSCPNTIVSRTE